MEMWNSAVPFRLLVMIVVERSPTLVSSTVRQVCQHRCDAPGWTKKGHRTWITSVWYYMIIHHFTQHNDEPPSEIAGNRECNHIFTYALQIFQILHFFCSTYIQQQFRIHIHHSMYYLYGNICVTETAMFCLWVHNPPHHVSTTAEHKHWHQVCSCTKCCYWWFLCMWVVYSSFHHCPIHMILL